MCEGTTVTWNVCQLLLCLLYINLKPAKTADWSISALQHQLARAWFHGLVVCFLDFSRVRTVEMPVVQQSF